MPPEVLAELLDGLDDLLAELSGSEGKATFESPIEDRRKALAAGFAAAAILKSRTELLKVWGDPR